MNYLKKPKGGRRSYMVDGFDRTTNTAYQLNGCYWHGGEKCHPTQEVRRYKAEELARLLRHSKINLVEMRECEWEKIKIDMVQT